MARALLFFCLCFAAISCNRQEKCPTQELKPHPGNNLRMAIRKEPQTLDPRLARDLTTLGLFRLLYEGLTRLDEHGQPQLALANSIEASPDGKSYKIKLREAYWNNGDRIIAEDFSYAWKSVLQPEFKAPNAHQLFALRLAKKAKQGDAFVDAVGVDALDDETLSIELEEPNPNFTQMLALPFYYPVNSRWILQRDWEVKKGVKPNEIPTNGPFSLEEWRRGDQLALKKNDKYWDEKSVLIDQVDLIQSDNATALKLFDSDHLDWVGSPFGSLPQEAVAPLREKGCLSSVPATAMYFLRFNTSRPPLNNEKLRKALSLAIDRDSITNQLLRGGQIAATSFVPSSMGLQKQQLISTKSQPSQAWLLVSQALQEMGLSRTEMPQLTLCYPQDEDNLKVAQLLQKQWSQLLQIEVKLQTCESKMMASKLHEGDYQIALGNWFADVEDPINFLELFEYRDNGTNSTGWSDKNYRDLLQKARTTGDRKERDALLAQAEQILVDSAPIAPLYQPTMNYLAKQRLKDAYLSPLGYIDLKNASIRHYNIDFKQEANSKKDQEEKQ